MTSTFDDFLNKRIKPQGEQVSYEKKREEWVADLSSLHEQLRGYLQKYIEEGKIHFHSENQQISEQFLGEYEAPVLLIGLVGDGNAQIRIRPYGFHVIGSRGRVDMQGPKGSAMLVRVPKDADGPRFITTISVGDEPQEQVSRTDEIDDVWKFAVREPRLRYYPLNKETFQNVFMKLIAG